MSKFLPLMSFMIVLLVAFTGDARAQQDARTAAPDTAAAAVEVPAGETSETDDGIRLELSQRMHEIWPASIQVEGAISKIAQQVPESERQQFKDSMLKAIDEKKLEQVSIEAMAEIFTKGELQAMLAYYSTPEAKAISEKMPIYNSLLQPEIVKMLDKAMLDLRTGGVSR